MPRKRDTPDTGLDAGILLIDDRTKAVMTDQPRHAQEAFKEQISRVREVVPSHFNKDDIALVLQYHEGDGDKAIQSFMEDGAKTVLNEWQSHGKKSKTANKRNKKKRKAQQNGADSATPPSEEAHANSTESSKGTTTQKQQSSHSNTSAANHRPPPPNDRPPSRAPKQSQPQQQQQQQQQQPQQPQPVQSQQQQKQQQQQQYPIRRDGDHRPHRGEGRGGDSRPGRQQQKQQSSSSASSHRHPDSGVTNKEKDVSHHASGERLHPSSEGSSETVHADKSVPRIHHDTTKAKKIGAVLERSSKDLHRTSVALTRHKGLLRDKLDLSEKSITKSFEEVQRFLDERKLAVMNEFLAVKQEAIDLLEAREEQGRELEMKTHRAPTMPEDQVQELRADIKQFVSDRKVDEEIGKPLRYTWNPDKLVELIKTFGDVVPIQHHYSTRRPSISSLSSFNTTSRTTSVSEDPGPLSARSLGESHDSMSASASQSQGVAPKSLSEMDMKAEAAEMAAKLQRTLTQGRKGPRNQKAPNPQERNQQGQRGDRPSQPNRGQGQGQQRSDSAKGQGSGPGQSRQGQGQGRREPTSQAPGRPQRNQNQGRQDRERPPKDQQGTRQGQGQSRQNQGQGQGSHQGHDRSRQGPDSSNQGPRGQQRQRRTDEEQGSHQGHDRSRQGPNSSNQGRRSQQQQQRQTDEEQDGLEQRTDNRFARRRQNKSRRQREEQEASGDVQKTPADNVQKTSADNVQKTSADDVLKSASDDVQKVPAETPASGNVVSGDNPSGNTTQNADSSSKLPESGPDGSQQDEQRGNNDGDDDKQGLETNETPSETRTESNNEPQPEPEAVAEETDTSEPPCEAPQTDSVEVDEDLDSDNKDVAESEKTDDSIDDQKEEVSVDSQKEDTEETSSVPVNNNDSSDTETKNSQDSVMENGDVVKEENDDGVKNDPKIEAKTTTNGPKVNGNLGLNGDVSHMNGDVIHDIANGNVSGNGDAPLPQRETKSRRSQKIEEVGKENSPVVNGVVELEPTDKEC